jgi:hypothetical protein
MKVRALALLEADRPWGVDVSLFEEAEASDWQVEPEAPGFAAAQRALLKGYGKDPSL